MLQFSWPWMLATLPVVAALGVWALWRGQRQATAVSSLRLWKNAEGGEGQARRRAVDPVWLLVLAAGLLAALAAAGPRWYAARALPQARVQWGVRSVGDTVEAWVRSDDSHLPQRLTLDAGESHQDVTREQLAEGVAVRMAAASRITLRLLDDKLVCAEQTIARPAASTFGLVTRTDTAGTQIDPALQRVFAIQPGARIGDPSVKPQVELVASREVTAEDVADAALVIAQPDTALPGITVGGVLAAPADGWTPESVDLPAFVRFGLVKVMRVHQATAAPPWRVIARVGGMPWIALRATDTGGTTVWLASEPTGDTTWPKDPSFVLFFADLLSRAGGTNATAVDWQPEESVSTAAIARQVNIAPWLGAAAIALLALAVTMFARRGAD